MKLALAIGVLARAPVAGRCKRRLLAAHEGGWIAGLAAAMLRDTLDGLLSVDAARYLVFASPLPADESAVDVTTRTQAAMDVLARHVVAPWEPRMPPLVATAATSLPTEDARTDVALHAAGAGDERARSLTAMTRALRREADVAVLVSADAPTAPIEPLAHALASLAGERAALLGTTDQGGAFLFAANHDVDLRLFTDLPWETPALAETVRLRCRELGVSLAELPPWYTVDEPSDVLRLLEELRRHPERAPRTAQFLVTNA